MGRREKPVDPDAGPIQRLAHDLRTLREKAGKPTYREMAGRTQYSTSALSQAAAGEQLPSLALTLAYAAALGADAQEWDEHWRRAHQAVLRSGQDGDAAPPYRGLARFEPGDRDLFFGRDRLVGELLGLVREHRFAAVFGPSGSGKSSLLRAGLIPQLRQAPAAGRPAVIRVLTPGERPAHTHRAALTPQDSERDTWLVVDQFEELFTLCHDSGERDRFLDLLLAARRPESRLRVVVAVRGDFYGHCAAHRELADALSRANLLVGPMDPAELREAITKPAAAADLSVERALTARIIDEVTGRPGVLPMLSHALLETWRHRRGRTLTMTAYEEAGGVHGAIAATAEQVYADLSRARQRTARRILLRLIAPGEGTAGTRRPAGEGTADTRRPAGESTADTRRPAARAELDAGAEEQGYGRDITVVVERLAAARLITLGDGTVELAHEALITSWPRLRAWIEEDRERLRENRRLGEAARSWDDLGRDPGALYRGTRLARAEELFALPEGKTEEDELTRSERAFLTAALAGRDEEQKAAARTARRMRTLSTALSAFLVLALAAGLLAWQQNRTSEQERAKAAARRVAAVADSLRSSDPRTAMLLGVAAWRIAPLTESRSALLGALAQPERDAFTDPEKGKDVHRFLTGQGRTLVSVAGRRMLVRDVTGHRPTASFRLPEDTGVAAVSPDARTLYLAGAGGVRLWDLAAGRAAADPRDLRNAALLDFGDDGRSYLVVRSRTPRRPGHVQLRRLGEDKVLFEVPVPGDLSDAALGAKGRLLAVCSSDGSLQVWDSLRRVRLPGPWDSASKGACDTDTDTGTVRFSPDGKLLALVRGTGIRVWDIPRERLLADLESLGDTGFADVDFTPDGAFLATVDDEELVVWRLNASSVQAFRRPLVGKAVHGLAWDPATGRVLRFLDGATVHSYDLTANLAPRWQSSPPDSAVLSPDGTVLATGILPRSPSGTGGGAPGATRGSAPIRSVSAAPGGGYRIALRSTRTGAVLAEPTLLPAVREGLDSVPPLLAFSPDGRALAISGTTSSRGSPRQRFTVWDVPEHKVRASVDLPGADDHLTLGIALGPGGRTLLAATSEEDGAAVEVWDTGSGRLRRTGTLPGFFSGTIAVRPDGRLLAGSGDQYARLPSGPVTGRALSEGKEVRALAFSPGSTRLAAGDSSGRVALWDGFVQRRTGVLTGTPTTVSRGAPEAVTALAFSPDGRTLAVGGASGTLQLWDAASQQHLGVGLPTPGEEIRSLAFSRDGGTVYASSPHIPLQSYPIAPEQAITRICDRTGSAGLSPADWKAYIPDVPYRRICG